MNNRIPLNDIIIIHVILLKLRNMKHRIDSQQTWRKASLYSTNPMLFKISNNLMYLRLMILPLFPNHITPFMGKTLRKKFSLSMRYISYTFLSIYSSYRLCATTSFSCINSIFSNNSINKLMPQGHSQTYQTTNWRSTPPLI